MGHLKKYFVFFIIAMFEKIFDGIEYDFVKEIPRIAVSFNNKIVEFSSFLKSEI